ncbi:kell blood group glycoprotein isoform X2 [Channa argus]|uniref:kell blood group glycoprotein isoform X2 n=1 Tax=Channa argus TaxID=215402 RepID=UPI00352020AE
MRETPVQLEPQLPIQPMLQPEPERGLQPLFPLSPVTQDPSEIQQQAQPQTEIQLPESPENQHQERPVWIKPLRLFLIFLGLSFCGILGIILGQYMKQSEQAGTVIPCLSQACHSASAHLSMSDDPFTQPCDYFLLTCRSDRFSPDIGARQRESNNKSASSAVQKAKGFYSSCLDTTSIESAGVEPFLTLIQKLGGWAVSGQWNQTDFNSTLSLLMRDYATFPFFNLYVGKNPNETARGMTKRYIQIDQPELLIPTEWNSMTHKSRVKTQTLRPFLASCETYLALLGASPSSSMTHVGPFISLSSELAVAAAPLQYRLTKGQLYQRMTIKDLQSKAPAIDWLRCLQAVFHPLPLTAEDHVLLHNLPYIVHMSPIIGKWLNKDELSNRGPLQTYMVLNLLHTLMPALDSRFSETAKNLSVALGTTEEVVPRWKHCVLETERGFDSVLTHLLSERPPHREVEEIIQNIFTSFKSKLHDLKWTDQKLFQVVMEKVQSLIPRLWTTKDISSKAEIDLLFSKVSVSTSFFSNYVQLLSLWQKRRSKLLSEQTEATDILSVTPFVLDNELLFPMGMFIPPLFHPTYPRAMNYGVIGFLIAKDILHLLLPNIYSQSETVHVVGECVWAHYLAVTESKASIGGALSLSTAQRQEVWVQYSALQIALQAYHQSLRNNPADTSISGFSHTRLFFSSFSQINCDSDAYQDLMPLEPSFLITVMCVKSDLCPTSLQCPNKTQQHLLQKC